MYEDQLLEVSFNLPSNENELSKADEVLEKIKIKFSIACKTNNLPDKDYIHAYEQTCRVLAYVGNLSEPAFAVEDQLEEMYCLKFKHAPELAKLLWMQHYENIHHNYNIIKNRCFRFLEEIDEVYINVHKKNPPNWNI